VQPRQKFAVASVHSITVDEPITHRATSGSIARSTGVSGVGRPAMRTIHGPL
jgi:hypothetical protein